ncbi:hypothetical protein ACX801_18155 [Arthrobacter bambusae]
MEDQHANHLPRPSGPMMEWRADGLVPTYTDGETFAWALDDRISLETDFGVPIDAWAEFVDPRTTTGKPRLATFRVHGPKFEIWKLSEPDNQGHQAASRLPRGLVTRYIPLTSWPSRPDRTGSSPLLCQLWDDAQAELQAKIEADRRARAADPLINVVDALTEAGAGYACAAEADDETGMARDAKYLRELIAEIAPRDLAEVLFRVTVQYGNACMSADTD